MLVDEILSYELSEKIGVKLKRDILKNIRTTHQEMVPFFSMQIMFSVEVLSYKHFSAYTYL